MGLARGVLDGVILFDTEFACFHGLEMCPFILKFRNDRKSVTNKSRPQNSDHKRVRYRGAISGEYLLVLWLPQPVAGCVFTKRRDAFNGVYEN